MAKFIRLEAKNGTVRELPLGTRTTLDSQFAGAKVQVIDSKTGQPVPGLKVRVRGKDLILSYSENGTETEVCLQDAGGGGVSPATCEASSASSPAESGASPAASLAPRAAAPVERHGSTIDDRSLAIFAFSVIDLAQLSSLASAASGNHRGGGVADTTSPAAPSGLDLASADDSGSSNGDNTTRNTSALTVTGHTEPNARVELFDAATSLGTATADNSGAFSLDVTLVSGSHAITARATDSAGNLGVASSVLTITVDTTAPEVVLKSAQGSSVTLTFDGPIDESNLPQAEAFAVFANGVVNPVTSLSASGSTITLTLRDPLARGLVSVSYIDQAGDGANAVQDIAGNDVASFSNGVVADGYVRDADIYIDVNGNGEVDGADYHVGKTDANGNFFIRGDAPNGAIIALGGVNIDTGVANTMALKAPAGAITINPLTTLVQAVIEANPGTTAEDAGSAVAATLGIDPTIDLTQYDPISSGDVATQIIAAQVATLTALAESDAGAGATVVANLASQIAAAAHTGAQVDLADNDTLLAAISGTDVSVDAAGAMATATGELAVAVSIEAISTAQAIALDRTAPAAPTAITLLAGADTGVLGDNITSEDQLQVRVSINTSAVDGSAAVAGDTLVVRVGGVEVASRVLAVQDIAAGAVSLVLPALNEGVQAISARLIDKAGNLGDTSNALDVTIDQHAPTSPTIDVVAGDDVVNGGEQAAAITGTAEPYATVALTFGEQTRTVVTGAAGIWTYALQASDVAALGQGAATISAVATDAAGNQSAAASHAFIVDTQASVINTTITEAQDNVDPTTGAVAAGATSNDNTLTLNGTLSAALANGDVLTILDGTTVLGTASVNGTTWTFATPGLANAAHSFTARVDDVAGNKGPASAAYAVTIDATVPTATVAITTATDAAAPVVGSVAGVGVTNDTNLTLGGTVSGTVATGDKVRVYDRGQSVGTANITDGTWTFHLADLGEGAHAFTAVIEGAGGNQGAFSAAYALTVDTVAPGLATINTIAGNDKLNAAEQGAVIAGTAQANASVAITLGGNVRTVEADASGKWSYALQAADISAMGQGAETISVTATDAAGNVSTAATRAISIDTRAPDAADIGAVAVDDLINASEQEATIRGTAEADALVAITLGGNIRLVSADGAGHWSYVLQASDITAMGQGAETISVTATDATGNVSTAATRAISIDTRAPNNPIIAAVTSDNIVNASEQKATITGLAEANANVAVTVLGQIHSVSADAKGDWSYTLQAGDVAAMGQGSETLSAVVSDAAGNTSKSVSRIFTIDTVAPAVSGIVLSDTVIVVGETALLTVTFSEPVAGFTLDDLTAENGTLKELATTDGGRTWTATYTPNVDVEDLTNVVRLVGSYTDVAGNAGSSGTSANFTIDTLPNRLPALTANQSITVVEDGSAQVTVTATDADGDTLSYSAGAASHGIVAGGANGVFTYAPAANYVGIDSFTVSASDGQGGTSQQVVNVTVSPVEDEATGTLNVRGNISEGGVVTATVSATDVDGAITSTAYQWQISADGTSGWTDIAGATGANYTIATDKSQVGKYLQVVGTTTDALGGTTTFTSAASPAIANVNHAPVVANAIAPQSSPEDASWNYTVPLNTFSDADGDPLTYSATMADGSSLPEGLLSFNADTRTFTGTPPANFNGFFDVILTASDASSSVSATISLTVTSVNDAPTVSVPVQAQSLLEDATRQITVLAEDVDGDTLTYTTSTPAHGTVAIGNGGVLTYTPTGDYFGADTFTVNVSDGHGGIAVQTVNLTITELDDAATGAITVGGTIAEAGTSLTNVSVTDVDGAITATAYQWQISANGTSDWTDLSGATGASYVIASDQSQVGKYLRVVATTTDTLGGTTTFTSAASAAIANVNDVPTVAAAIVDQTGSTGVAWTYQLPAGAFSDADGDTLTFSATLDTGAALPSWLSFSSATRTFTGTPTANDSGILHLKVAASDGVASVSDAFDFGIAAGPIAVANSQTYTATTGVDTFVIDANQTITATIVGFGVGDLIQITNLNSLVGINFENAPYYDNRAVLRVVDSVINMTELTTDNFGSEVSFEQIYGTHAITYVI